MKNEFATYEQSLELKNLGFDEECLSYYKDNKFSDTLEEVENSTMTNQYDVVYIAAPLKQQVFRWFREKGFYVKVQKECVGIYFGFYWTGAAWIIVNNGSYEEERMSERQIEEQTELISFQSILLKDF